MSGAQLEDGRIQDQRAAPHTPKRGLTASCSPRHVLGRVRFIPPIPSGSKSNEHLLDVYSSHKRCYVSPVLTLPPQGRYC